MKPLFLSLAAALAISSPTFAASLAASSPCVKAAVADTEAEFPLNQAVKAKFFEWGSSQDSAWGTFNTKNLGFDGADALSYESVADLIHTNFFAAEDLAERDVLITAIKGKRVFSVSFRMQGGDLERFYSVMSEKGDACQVKHISPKIDDFDNG